MLEAAVRDPLHTYGQLGVDVHHVLKALQSQSKTNKNWISCISSHSIFLVKGSLLFTYDQQDDKIGSGRERVWIQFFQPKVSIIYAVSPNSKTASH